MGSLRGQGVVANTQKNPNNPKTQQKQPAKNKNTEIIYPVMSLLLASEMAGLRRGGADSFPVITFSLHLQTFGASQGKRLKLLHRFLSTGYQGNINPLKTSRQTSLRALLRPDHSVKQSATVLRGPMTHVCVILAWRLGSPMKKQVMHPPSVRAEQRDVATDKTDPLLFLLFSLCW